ncbi:hypothetical protein ACI2JA_03970 [Alkalihalobacillus sp. NPDC078783]
MVAITAGSLVFAACKVAGLFGCSTSIIWGVSKYHNFEWRKNKDKPVSTSRGGKKNDISSEDARKELEEFHRLQEAE